MTYLILSCAAFAGGLIQPITGFGAGVIVMIALSSFFDITIAPTLSAAICFFQSAFLLMSCWRGMRLKKHIPVVLSYLLCSFCIISLLERFDLHLLTALFGGFLVLIAVYFLCFAKRFTLKPSLKAGLVCGIVSGCCAGAFSIGGPTVALYYVAACEEKNDYIANMQFLFTVSNFLVAALRMSRGFYDAALTPLLLCCSAAVIAGTMVGKLLSRRLTGVALRKAVYIGVGISGVITLCQQLL